MATRKELLNKLWDANKKVEKSKSKYERYYATEEFKRIHKQLKKHDKQRKVKR